MIVFTREIKIKGGENKIKTRRFVFESYSFSRAPVVCKRRIKKFYCFRTKSTFKRICKRGREGAVGGNPVHKYKGNVKQQYLIAQLKNDGASRNFQKLQIS